MNTQKRTGAANNFREARAGEAPTPLTCTAETRRAIVTAHQRLEARGLLYNGSWRRRPKQ